MSIVENFVALSASFGPLACYLFILFATLLESSPIFGLFIPGQIIILAGGFLAKQGVVSLTGVMVYASMGAILGDCVGYALGVFKLPFLDYVEKKIPQSMRTSLHELVSNHTGKSIILGRFNPVTRAFASYIMGTARVPFKKFMFYNVVGGLSWGVSFTALGFVVGASYPLLEKLVGRFFFVAFILSILFIYIYRFINKRWSLFTKDDTIALAVGIFGLYLFSKMLDDFFHQDYIIQFDYSVAHALANIPGTEIIATLLQSWVILAAIIAVAILVRKKYFFETYLLFGSSFMTLLILLPAKYIMSHLAPSGILTSFASTPSALFLILCAVVIRMRNGWTIRIATGVAYLLLVFAQLISWQYWLSDILAGMGAALFSFTFTLLFFHILVGWSRRKECPALVRRIAPLLWVSRERVKN